MTKLLESLQTLNYRVVHKFNKPNPLDIILVRKI